MDQIVNLNLRYIKAREGDKEEIFMIDITMINEVIKIGIGQIGEIGELNLMDKVEVDQGMNKIIGEEILEVT